MFAHKTSIARSIAAALPPTILLVAAAGIESAHGQGTAAGTARDGGAHEDGARDDGGVRDASRADTPEAEGPRTAATEPDAEAPDAARPSQSPWVVDATTIQTARAKAQAEVETAKAAVDVAEARLASVSAVALDVGKEERAFAARQDAGAEIVGSLDSARTSAMKELVRLDPHYDVDAGTRPSIDRAEAEVVEAKAKYEEAKASQKRLEAKIESFTQQSRSLKNRLFWARRGRCQTAFCWGGDGTEYALEPMLELPIGVNLALGSGALAQFANAEEISIQFSAGLRFWFLHDLASVSLYFAKPVFDGGRAIRLPGSSFDHPSSSIRRLGPSLALGFFGDILFFGAGFDQLRNGPTNVDPAYLPNQVLSRSITLSIGLAPFASIRNGAAMVTGGNGK